MRFGFWLPWWLFPVYALVWVCFLPVWIVVWACRIYTQRRRVRSVVTVRVDVRERGSAPAQPEG